MNGKAAAILLLIMVSPGIEGCKPPEPNELDKLPTTMLSIKGRTFKLWIVDEPAEVQRGLMHVTAEQMGPLADGTERGMLFVFDHEQYLSFWMKDTVIPLDIAYVTTTGTVVSTHRMAPLDERIGQYPSGAPARFAIEVNAGVWDELHLEAGDHVDIPSSLLKRTP